MTTLTAAPNPHTAATASLGLPDRPALDTKGADSGPGEGVEMGIGSLTRSRAPAVGELCRHYYIVDIETDVCSAAPYRHHHGRCRLCGFARTFQYYYPAESGAAGGEINMPSWPAGSTDGP